MEATLPANICVTLKSNSPYQTACLRLIALLSIAITGPLSLRADLANDFAHPPESAKPWVYWMWLQADTTPAAMTRDLEQMKAKGIAGFILYDTGSGHIRDRGAKPGDAFMEYQYKTVQVGKEFRYVKTDDYKDAYDSPLPTQPVAAWTPHWRELIRFVARESARLGLKFCLTVGLSDTSGAIAEEYGNQKLIWTETAVTEPATFDGILPEEPPVQAPKKGANRPDTAHYRRDIAVLAIPDAADFPASQVIDLTSRMNASGRLNWTPPSGSWKILRFSQVATGAYNDWGYFTGGMSTEAVDKTWEVTMAPLLEEMSPEERKGLIGVEEDSWEGGITTWTKHFPAEFKQRRGYDLTPYLPVLAGAKMADDATRQRVQRDYKLTIGDLMADYHYGHLEKLCKENELVFYSEAAGPNLNQADLMKNISRVDVAMGEFWYPSAHRGRPEQRFWTRNAACATHIYGMPVNMDEAFTSIGPAWEETPFTMKPVVDQAFCDGLNRICFHNFSHSPSLTAKPGYVYLPGTRYDPGITWWEQTPAFNAYLSRCSALLQAGRFVADAVIYQGDNIGRGEPMKKLYPTLGDGYDHDNCNEEVLLTRMRAKDGRLVLPDGMSYRVLVLPDNQPITLAALEKVASLIEAGATIVGPPPAGLPGLSLAADQAKFDGLVARLWGSDSQSSAAVKRRLGAGCLVSGLSARQALQDAGVPPDFEQSGLSDAGTIDWIHRKAGDADIYFVTSRWQPAEKVECTFRVSGRQPELWDPVTGAMRDAAAFHQQDGRTVVPLEFDPCGSTFVIFRKPITANTAGAAKANYLRAESQLTLSGTWEVSFDPKWGGPEKVSFDQLVDWTTRPEPGIKFYSGTAIYRKEFNLPTMPAKGTRLLLDLGSVHEVASVRLNGRDLGVVWTKPARVDITDAVKAAGNALEITIVNLWPNRLIGDEALPKESRVTETNMRKFGTTSPLLPSGLIGPVSVLSLEEPK
jgi:alpha-L-rhamnosidase